MLALALVGGLAVHLWRGEGDTSLVLGLLLVVLGAVVAALALLMRQIRQFLLTPMSEMYAWSLRMCDGDFEARIPPGQFGQFAKLSFHVNRLSEALDRMANEMDDMVWSQTQRLKSKNESLETLYEITEALNGPSSLDTALPVCAARLAETLGARKANVVVFDEAVGGKVSRRSDAATERFTQIVPLEFNGDVVGELCITAHGADVPESGPSPGVDEESQKLIESVARHLGMAIAQSRLTDETLKLSVMRERTLLAYELHDSLAQTLASLRLHIHMLDESLSDSERARLKGEVLRIEGVLDEANTELRELIAHFRAPVDEGGLKPALESLISRCRQNSSIDYVLQSNGPDRELPAASELQVLRIVREALTNIEKHSKANMVRVLVNTQTGGACRVLIEDDGIGLQLDTEQAAPGDHIGLSIMRDRAQILGGTLSVDSEPGEGTRILLEFDPAHEVALPGLGARSAVRH
jgi:two-component system nitrate/nitrite sensor histidine kinase NarX